MQNFFRLLFNLYPGEGRKAWLFIILGLAWSIGSYGTFTLSEGMFLEHVGAKALPQSYFAIAASMCVFSVLLIFSLNRFSIRYLLFLLIAIWIAANCIFYFLLPSESKAIWFLFKVIGWIIPLSTYIVYWAFVDQYYDLQDAKRFFCLFNAVIFLGDSLGGGVISFLLRPFGIQGVLLLFTTTMCLSLPFIFLISKTVAPVLEEHVENADAFSSINFRSILKTILKSKFTLYLLLFYFLMQLLAIVTEYNYMDSFEKAFSIEQNRSVTEFIGTCGMWISLANMFLAMFMYGRLVKKIGVNNIILIAPSLFMIIFVAWVCKEALPLAILGMIAREGVVYTFDDNNLNLLISGVPTKVKNQLRISIESFIEPAGMFCSALLLIFLQTEGIKLGLLLSILSAITVIFLRKYYPKAIFRNLAASAIRFEKKTGEWLRELTVKDRKKTEFHLLSNLKKHDEKGQLVAYEYLLKVGNTGVLPHLLNHIGKLSLPGKLHAIDLLSESKWAKDLSVIERLERWCRILPHPAIKSNIHFYFAKHRLLRPERVMHDLHNKNLGLRAAAILSLKTTHHGLHLPSFYSLAIERLRDLLSSKEEDEICIGLKILESEQDPENIGKAFAFLKHPSLTVNRAAAKTLAALASNKNNEHAKPVIATLSSSKDPQVRYYILCALEKFADLDSVRDLILSTVHFRSNERKLVERILLGIGKPASKKLIEITMDSKVHDRCRLLAGKIIGKIEIKTLQSHIHKIVGKEIERAFFYHYHAYSIQDQIPEQDLTVLKDALITGYHSIIDFIIQLLGVAGSIEECEVLSHTLRSKNRKIRAQAVESLEKTCDAKIFSLLEPLIDERGVEDKKRLYLKGGRIPYNLTQLLDAMSHSPSVADQIVSVGLKARLKTSDWKKSLEEKLESDEEIFQHFAHDLLQSMVHV